MKTNSEKRPLNFWDFLVLSIIFFGYFTWISLGTYFSPIPMESISTESFSSADNWNTIVVELILATISLGYLFWIKFDFSLIAFSVNRWTLFWVVMIFVLGGLTHDIYYIISNFPTLIHYPINSWLSIFPIPNLTGEHFVLSLFIFSVINGFYEEFFFMGLAFAVKPTHQKYALVLSIFVRFIFHTYQGMESAITIALMGIVFIFLREKIKSVVPFMLAHTIFDIFGVGFLGILNFLLN